MMRVSVSGPRRPAGTRPMVYWQVTEGGDWIGLEVMTPDLGCIFCWRCPGGVIPLVAAMAFEAAVGASAMHGRN